MATTNVLLYFVMSYQNFNVKLVIEKLGFLVKEEPFLKNVVPVQPGAELRGAIHLLRTAMVFGSEKSRSEALIAPILSEAAVQTHTRLFSGETFDVDSESGLNGVVDFLFTRDAPGRAILDPVLCIVEAKKADMDSLAFGQCMATMIAAQRYNKEPHTVYGCVTTGTDWQFLKLEKQRIDVDPTLCYENQLDVLLGILVSFLRPTSTNPG